MRYLVTRKAKRIISESIKYLETWRILLKHPSHFLEMTMEQKRKNYAGPWQFFFFSAMIFSIGSFLCLYAIKIFVSPLFPILGFWSGITLDYKSLLVNYSELFLLSLLWYLVFARRKKPKPPVRTTAPKYRIFYELLYLHGGPSVLFRRLAGLAVASIVWGFFSKIEFGIGPYGESSYEGAITLLIIQFLLILVLVLLGFSILVPSIYNTILARTFYNIGRWRAFLICVLLSFLAATIITPFRFLDRFVTYSSLSETEQLVSKRVSSLAVAESAYRIDNETYANLEELQQAVPNLLSKRVFQLYLDDFLSVLEIEHEMDGYKFIVESSGDLCFVHAVPQTYRRGTEYSFLVWCPRFLGGVPWMNVGDHRGAKAVITDKMLIPGYPF